MTVLSRMLPGCACGRPRRRPRCQHGRMRRTSRLPGVELTAPAAEAAVLRHQSEPRHERVAHSTPRDGVGPIGRAFDLHASCPLRLLAMDRPDEALSAEDRYVLEMLDEAREQYETYLSIKAAADMSILRELTSSHSL